MHVCRVTFIVFTCKYKFKLDTFWFSPQMTTLLGVPPLIHDRTSEFYSCVQSISKLSRERNRRNNNNYNNDQNPSSIIAPKSEFQINAFDISTNIRKTTNLLQQLSILAEKKTLFDDKSVEISELSFIIKKCLFKIKEDITKLSLYQKNLSSHNQIKEHSNNVIKYLQNNLGDITTRFQGILETKTKNMKIVKSRTKNFISTAQSKQQPVQHDSSLQSNAPNRTYSPLNSNRPTTNSPLYGAPGTSTLVNRPASKIKNIASDNPYSETYLNNSDTLSLPDQTQQMLLLEEQQQDTYSSERSSAIETIESTIQELGGIFSQLAVMVAEQRDVVQRIDANIEDIQLNVSGAQRQLLKYFNTVSSNRWLYLKIFGILTFFFFIWAIVS